MGQSGLGASQSDLRERTPAGESLSPASVWRNTSQLNPRASGGSTQQFLSTGPQGVRSEETD